MYNKGFYLSNQSGNNIFSYEKRKNKKLFIPSICYIDDIEEILIQDEKDKVAFEDFNADGNLCTCYGLKNFYRVKWKEKEILLFDNHNHAFYFWFEARNKGIIGDNNILIHIDEHADTRDNGEYISKPDSYDMDNIFNYTNKILNVGNYIIPAQKEGIISEIVQIRNTTNINDYIKNKKEYEGKETILNLDLDFFQPELDYIDYNIKKELVLHAAENAKIITVATSPFFINQKLAIKIFKDLFFS